MHKIVHLQIVVLLMASAAAGQTQRFTVSVPTFSKQFIPSTIGPGSASTLRFDITSTNLVSPETDLAFMDPLPAGVVIATPSSASTTCGGTLDAPDGGGTITFSDGVVGAGASCSIFVNVTSAVVGIHSNISGDLTSSAGNSGPAMADLTVDDNRPGFSKQFSPSSIPVGSRTTLTFEIDNNNEGTQAFRVAFTDHLPAGVAIADPANASTDCDASFLTAMPGSDLIALSPNFGSLNPTLGAPGFCTVSVDVVGTVIGIFNNISGELTSQTSLNAPSRSSGFATAALEVTGTTLALTKEFTDDPVLPGATATLEFTIRNVSRTETATDIAFVDNLDATLSGLEAVGLPAMNVCGAGSQISGTGLLSFSGGTLGSGETCMFSVTLLIPAGAAAGEYPNLTTAVTANLGGAFVGNQASDSLFVSEGPTLVKDFAVSTAGTGETVTINFTVTNNSSTSAATDISFSDNFSMFLAGGDATFTSFPANGFCGAGSMIFTFVNLGERFLSMAGGQLAAGDSCNFSVDFIVPLGTVSGLYVNTTENIMATVDGMTQIGNQASDTLEVVAAPLLSKSFTDDPVLPGATVTLEFTIDYDEQAVSDATGISFSDNLGAVIAGLVAVGLPMNDVCGMGSQISGTGVLSFTGGTLAPGTSCTFSVTLQVPAGAAPGSHINTTSDVTATVGGVAVTGGPASDDLQITALTFSKSFTDDPVIPGDTVTLEFTITNVTAADDATNIFFQDSLGSTLSGLQAMAPLPVNPCGAGSTLSGTSTLQLTGGNLTAGTFCTFAVTLLVPGGAADGDYLNSTSILIATIDGTPNLVFPPATDVLSVSSQMLQITKTFTDDPVMPGDTVTLEFTITNLDDDPAQDITFTDDLNAALSGLAAVGLPAMNVCGAGSQISGAGMLTLTGGNIAGGSFCTFNVTLQVPPGASAGTFTNTTSQVSGIINDLPVSGPSGSDDLVINLLTFAKAFLSASVPGSSVTLRFMIENLSTTDTASGIGFTDDLNAVIAGLAAVGLPANNVCGAGSQLAGTTFLTLTSGELPPMGSCTFDVTLNVPLAATPGSFNNTSSDLFLSGLKAADAATAALEIEPPPLFMKAFNPDPIIQGGTSTLTFTINNSASSLNASGLNFTDPLPAGVVVASPPNASTTCTGGTLTAAAASGTISYSGGTVLAGASCMVQVDVTSSTAGIFNNTTGSLTSSSGNSGTANDGLTVNPPPDFSKSFAPDPILVGGISTLTFTVDNTSSTVSADNLDFTDNLPAEVLVANPANASTTCSGGTLTAVSGSGVISYSGGSLAAASSCTISIDVTSSTAGSHPNTSGNLTSTLGNSGAASDTLTVNQPPDFSKSFSPNPILVGGTSTLTFTIDNTSSTVSADSLDYTDNLPAGVEVANPANASTTCSGGTLTATSGSGVISYSGGSLAAASSCTVTVDVTATSAGMKDNTTGDLTSTLGNSGTASDTLTVNPPPAFSKLFSPNPIPLGSTSTLTFTIDNTESTVSADSLDFTDNLPTEIEVASPANASTTCSGGTLTAVSGSGTISYSGGSVAAGASCTISVDVTSSTAGMHPNTTGDLTSSLGNSGTASDTLTVNPPPAFSKSFSPNPIPFGGTSALTFSIDNNASTAAADNLDFSDSLPAEVLVASPANASTTCSGGTLTAVSGSGTISYSGGSVAAGSSCTISVDVSSSTEGMHPNTTGDLTSSLGNSGTASDTLTVQAPPALSKLFAPNPIAINGTTILTFTIDNSASTFAASGLSFTDDLPAGVMVGTPANASTTCTGGTLTAVAGSSQISYSGGTVAASSSCTISVDASSDSAGMHVNTTSELSFSTGTSPAASDTLTVIDSAIVLSKSFGGAIPPLSVSARGVMSPGVLPGGLVELEYTLTNTTMALPLSNIAFTDDFNAVIPGLAATNLPMADVCGTGSMVSGTTLLSFTGGSLASGAPCTFSVTLKVPADAPSGSFPSTSSDVTADAPGGAITGPPAAATLIVVFFDFSKAFSGPVDPGEIVTLTFMISNPDPFNAASNITFSDDLGAVLPGLAAVGLPANGICGVGSQIDGTSVITLSGGSLGPGEDCSFGVDVKIPDQLAAGGTFTNVTSPLEATVDGSDVEGDPATAATAALQVDLITVPLMNTWGLTLLAGLMMLAACWRLKLR